MDSNKDFLEADNTSTDFSISISSNNGKISITSKSRFTPGEALKIVSNDDVSDAQLSAICNVLDGLP